MQLSHKTTYNGVHTLHISIFSPKVIKIRAKSWLKKKAEIYNTAISFLKRRKAKEREATNQAGKAKLFCISLAMTTTTKSF